MRSRVVHETSILLLYDAVLHVPTVTVSSLKLDCSLYNDHWVGVVFVKDFMFTAV